MRRFYGAAYTDAGTVKTVNQDSLTMKIADTDSGETVFAVMCDGMGGLEQGELASATVVRAYEEWYERKFMDLSGLQMPQEQFTDALTRDWESIVQDCNVRIRDFGRKNGVNLGTTLTVFLAWQNDFYVMHVGDCRIYEFTAGGTRQITRDQTYVAREVELGHMTAMQAKNDTRRNVLLQCIGVNEIVRPDYLKGRMEEDAAYLICSDGFWHVPPTEVLYRTCYKDMQMLEWSEDTADSNSTCMRKVLDGLASRSKQSGERDNLSAILIQAK